MEVAFVDKSWLDTIIIVGISCFTLCIMNLSKVSSAKMGMLYGMIGMLSLIIGFWLDDNYTYGHGTWLIGVCIAPGCLIGLASALYVEMTGLPEMVGAYNGLGGLAAALEGIALYVDPNAAKFVRGGLILVEEDQQEESVLWVQAIAMILSIAIGCMTFTGSVIAVLKLHGTIASKPRVVPLRGVVYMTILVGIVVGAVLAFCGNDRTWNDRDDGLIMIMIVAGLSSLWGIIAVLAIGGGDMPVSISFLNSLSGFSTSAAGFMTVNKSLVISGAFVGCSGIILTLIMCKAMNRSITQVLLGGFGGGDNGKGAGAGSAETAGAEGTITQVTAEDVVEALTSSKSVIIVPGYGMAVAKAQHAIAEMTAFLRKRGIQVRFAIHPVAGRLPGHMNVLLAEARIPYEIILSMDEINHEFPNTDAVLIIGANDTVNLSAQTDPGSPIAGMPVLEVWKAKQTYVMKRTLRVGYAGVDNPLFVQENNAMFLGDAKSNVDQLVGLLRDKAPTTAMLENDPVLSADVENVAVENNAVLDPIDTFIADIPMLHEEAFLTIGVVNETDREEKRVALVPPAAKRLLKKGMRVILEKDAGIGAGFSDQSYEDIGVTILSNAKDIYASADVVIKIKEATKEDINMVQHGNTLISFVGPRTDNGQILMHLAAEAGINLIAVDAIPRVSRAQSLDVLSSQAKIAGYRSVYEAANVYQRFFNGEVTAAGKFDPCKVLVVGAGVAGLAAIGTAANMGAIVRAFDTRLETKDQVESVGGEFLILKFDDTDGGDLSGYAKAMSKEFYEKEMAMFNEQAKECSIIITTAAIPGRPAPKLIMKEAVDNLQPGSVIVDLAGATGGNCELTRPGETYVYNDKVTIIGTTDLISRMSWQASSMYSNNMANLMEFLCPAPAKDALPSSSRKFEINMEDNVVRGMTVVKDGAICWPPPVDVTSTAASTKPASNGSFLDNPTSLSTQIPTPSIFSRRLLDLATVGEFMAIILAASFFCVVSLFAHFYFVNMLLYFILAGVLGYYLILNVEPALFSPLMSTSNSLSGVVILGGMFLASLPLGSPSNVLGCVAITTSTINVVGGFAVSYRMLLMFKSVSAV